MKNELNSNIPQGRGLIKWLPMATIPEQYKRISTLIDEQAMIDPPIYENDTLIGLEESLKRSVNQRVILRYWNNGYEVQIDCRIEYIEYDTQVIIVNKDDELLNIEFKYIYEVKE